MFRRKKDRQDQKQYAQIMQDLFEDTFNLTRLDEDQMKQDALQWKEWVRHKERPEWSDLCDLIGRNVRDVFKARALVIMLAPRITLAPFAWNCKMPLDNYLFGRKTVSLRELPLKLQAFAFALLRENIDFVRAQEADKDLYKTLVGYNYYILKALVFLEEDDPFAEQLFSRYQLNDPISSWGVDESSGHHPFGNILQSGVPEKWKRLADAEMRSIILKEQEGSAKPREEYEHALPRYLDRIQDRLSRLGGLPYSTELLASQIDFVLGLPNTNRRMLFQNQSVYDIVRLLKDADEKELLHQFAQHIAFSGGGMYDRFRAFFKDNTYTAAIELRQEFGIEDPYLDDRLRQIIAEAHARFAKNEAYKERRQADLEAILEQMR